MEQPLKTLTKDDLVVLFEWLSKSDENEKISFTDLSELVVLHKIHASLEKELKEPFDSDYTDIFSSARNSIKKDFEERMGKDTWLYDLMKTETNRKR